MVDDALKHGRLDTESGQENRPSDNSIGKTKWFKWFLGAIVFVVVSIAVFLLVMKGLPWGMEKRGQLGDMFGVIGALFSGLAFAGVVVTMLQQNEDLNLQRKDLELQRREIAQTNRELEQQRTVMQEQNRTIMLQRFENTFFNMLTLLQKNLDEVFCYDSNGSRALEILYGKVYDNVRQLTVGSTFKTDDCVGIYVSVVERVNLYLYYDTLSFLLHLIDSSDFLTEDEKNSYASILKTKLSKSELLLLFYEGLTDSNESIHFVNHEYHFKYYIEKYSLFKNIRFDLLLKPIHERLYSEKAYGSAYKYRSEV